MAQSTLRSLQPHLLGKVGPAILFMEVSFLAENKSQRLEKFVDIAIRKQGISPQGQLLPNQGLSEDSESQYLRAIRGHSNH